MKEALATLQNVPGPGDAGSASGPEVVPAVAGRVCLGGALSVEPGVFAVGVSVLVVVGSAALLPLWLFIFRVWATDPLRSIGAVFPLFALAGVLMRWRETGWSQGTFWGVPVILIAIPMARLVSYSFLDLSVGGGLWGLLHGGFALFIYGVGAALLFGGWRLLRAALAPLCLLLAINPVPHAFNTVADLPLQQLSAGAARGFAHLIGLQPTGEQLRMMFAPNFGMLIVPGCNGVRGSVTLAYLTLIFGYTRRLRPWRLAGVSLAALLFGYVLNWLRLCLLVIYYRVGLTFESIQKHGVGVDYAIGCTLFLLATAAIGLAVRGLEPAAGEFSPSGQAKPSGKIALNAGLVGRCLCLLVPTLLFAAPELYALAAIPRMRPAEAEVAALFPAQAGPYRLIRTYAERDGDNGIAQGLADYADDRGHRLTLGLWLASGEHMVSSSRLVHGQRPEWTGSFDTRSRLGQPVRFAAGYYDDGVTRVLDADADCSLAGCADVVTGDGHRSLLFRTPPLRELALPDTGKRLPILLEREWPANDSTPSDERRREFEADARLFTGQLDIQHLVENAGSRP